MGHEVINATVRSMRKLSARGITAILLLGTAWAQNGRANTNAAQAVLHIQVVVIPTVFSPASSPSGTDKTPVSYSLTTLKQQQETIVQEMSLRESGAKLPCSPNTCDAVLRMSTIVPR